MKVILVVLVCVVGAEAQVDVFDALKVMVENVWDSFKEFIKRPPRSHMKRVNVKKKTEEIREPVGFILRLKTTSTAADIEITTAQNTMPNDMMYYFQRSIHKPVLLPLIPAPKWRALDGYGWYDYQESERFALPKDQFQGGRKRRYWDSTTFALSVGNGDETTRTLSDEPAEEIGVMMFI